LFVEFGVGGGEQGNCVLLADWGGWAGLFIESSVPDYSRLSLKYRRNPLVRTRHAVVEAGNVEALFTEERVPAAFDVLSIDIDGNDFWVWEAITAFRPRIVVIEYNANLALDSELVMPRDDRHQWDGTDYFGASLGAYRKLGQTKGYELVHTELGSCAFAESFSSRSCLNGVEHSAQRPEPVEEHPRSEVFGPLQTRPHEACGLPTLH